jgi:2-polyprenyl-3-methyl-5-hydroxy-6-metoxy-1,4-benzoquinol methylase
MLAFRVRGSQLGTMTSPSSPAETIDNWDSHWSDFGEAISSNPAQVMRHNLVIQLFAAVRPASGSNVIDFGSGHGDFLEKFQQRFPNMNLLGLELSETGVQISRRKVPSASFVAADLFKPPAVLSEYEDWGEYAVCCEVLEHVDDPAAFLQIAKTYLKDRATLFVTVPGGKMSALDRFIGHRRHFDRELIRKVLEAAGFSVTKVILAGFPFFNLYRLMIIARGDKLATDIKSKSWFFKVLLATISQILLLLFRLNLRDSPFGWQVVAVAQKNPANSGANSPTEFQPGPGAA